MFDVACTRATDRLIITYYTERGGHLTAGPSRFLHEAGIIADYPRPSAG